MFSGSMEASPSVPRGIREKRCEWAFKYELSLKILDALQENMLNQLIGQSGSVWPPSQWLAYRYSPKTSVPIRMAVPAGELVLLAVALNR
ncbi:predicted protein [Sclerotinia sclerotiorum 1980 UF-70]|uniref:Uncharacterized protein n=1 Tax=Sclerotinia sclerotiorum (strain ATCC 18683 / 1980 / Ss-1) TaxID=665079 RepID=A7EUU8_SCLS1|nr:predicted protein [Sclerotinia sclerotiorum 1980 UF-70]EDN93240.1 predicted protein [Sclerotinia sclerotiorum 1980 UF-70]